MSEPKQLEKYGAYKDQADAWNAVWEALAKHNPEFIYEGQTGEEAALTEIRRLQTIEGIRASNSLCKCGQRFGLHPIQPPWWPCMLKDSG